MKDEEYLIYMGKKKDENCLILWFNWKKLFFLQLKPGFPKREGKLNLLHPFTIGFAHQAAAIS